MPGQFDQTSDYIVSMLKPVIKPKDGGGSCRGRGRRREAQEGEEGEGAEDAAARERRGPLRQGARLVIAKVLEVGHVENSDKLYCCKVQVGPEETRQVITGLRKFVPEAELTNKLVLCILNLKVAKLAGQTSEAMILATTCELNGELSVKVVNVPETATVGDVVGAEGVAPGAAGYPKECKSKFWDAVKENSRSRAASRTYDGKTLSCAAGPCVADASVLDGSPIS